MFISLEGIEGSGKTTQIEFMRRHLETKGVACAVTREPGGTPIGKKIRAILLDPHHRDLDPRAELLLYMADRAQHIGQVILPQLETGKTVICDRYFDATLAYQGVARKLDTQLLVKLHELLFAGLTPDLTLLLDLPPEVGLARAWKQLEQGDRHTREARFEEEALAFHNLVRDGYLALAKQAPHRFHIIDAARPPDQVTEQIVHALSLVAERIR